MPGISGSVSYKKVVVGGGGGVVSGTMAVNSATNVALFTTPASPTDSEYVVKISGVIGGSANYAYGAAAGAAASGSAQYGVPISHEIVCGPGAAVSLPIGSVSAAVPYCISYSYAAYKVQ